MTNMNDWNELQQRRGAEAALLQLRYDMAVLAAEVFGFLGEDDVLRLIDKHIDSYRK